MASAKVLLLLCCCIGLLSFTIAGPCSNMVKKLQSGILNYRAEFNFTVPVTTTPETGWVLVLKFDQKFTGVGVWQGSEVEYNGELKYANIRNTIPLVKGAAFAHTFRINYGEEIPAPPQLIEASFQAVNLCLG